MSVVTLTGLLGSHPLGALAAFGLLRLLGERDSTTTLHFEMSDDWIAKIHSAAFGSADTLLSAVAEWINSSELSDAIDWAEDVRIQPDAFRTLLKEALRSGQRVRIEMMSALAADGATDSQKGLIKPSAFYMVSGLQSFLGGLREIVAQARQSPEAIAREALFGPWRYLVRVHSLGWDPNTERLYALRSRAPTSEKPACVAGAVLLALWALPLMPSVSHEGRALTVGFQRGENNQVYAWPVFSTPIGLGDLRTLLQVGRRGWVHAGKKRQGIEAIFESDRFEFGQGYAVLRPPRVLA